MERATPVWFRKSPAVGEAALVALVDRGDLNATIRIGASHEWHPKGYVVGDEVPIRVKDAASNDLLVRRARVTEVVIKRLCLFAPCELVHTIFYKSWRDALHDLVFFEGNPVDADPIATLVRFEYVDEDRKTGPDDPRSKHPGCFLRYPSD